MTELRQKVADAEIPDDARRQLLARVDRSLQEAEGYIERNRARIELDEQNRSVVEEIDRRRQHLIEVDDELAKMVDEFNSLMDQERFSEAVVLAKKARELSPDNPTVESMIWKSRFAERLMVEMSLRDRSQIGVEGSLTSVIESGIPWDDRIAIEFPEGGNAKFWEDLTRRRKGGPGGSRTTVLRDRTGDSTRAAQESPGRFHRTTAQPGARPAGRSGRRQHLPRSAGSGRRGSHQ